jgi:hypothetical protein
MTTTLREQLAQSPILSQRDGVISTNDYLELLDYLDGLMDGLSTVMNSELETDKRFNGWH